MNSSRGRASLWLVTGLLLTVAMLIAGFALFGAAQEAPPETETKPPAAAKPSAKHRANRLATETSPYLLLHAHNPVDWYPWGEEALAKAKRENKVIFLSIGYSSCHWCHVMERESFVDPEIAALLNDHFVCIKVDREERPDIDSIYMTSLQIYNQVTGSGRGGGWPLSMFLTPKAEPFFGGTYFPPRDGDRGAAMGFLTLLKRVHDFWTEQPDRIQQDADTLTQLVKTELDGRRSIPLEAADEKLLAKVLDTLEEQFDPLHGGFGYVASQPQRPKFPEPSNLLFLIDRLRDPATSEKDQERARRMLVTSLDHMARGGIRDHVGGGFHRYSVDRFWHIPHFEKMLYDNGQLASVYAEAFKLTGDVEYREVVEEIVSFIEREMTHADGAFYAALDADSEDEEGKFYRWQSSELEQLLPAAERDESEKRFATAYQLAGEPNFEEHFYVPQLSQSLAKSATDAKLTRGELRATFRPLLEKLLAARSQRPRPLTDSKILTSWNGLMIRGLADAGRVLERPDYIASAARAADFVLKHLRTADGRLLRTYSQGQAKLNAYLDDYAFLVDGLIALYRATGDRRWLESADELTKLQLQLFWDDTRGGFYFTSDDHESLLARGMDPVDGAEPSGNSVSADNLLFLAQELARDEYREKAQRTIQAVAGVMHSSPSACPRMAVALAELLRSS